MKKLAVLGLLGLLLSGVAFVPMAEAKRDCNDSRRSGFHNVNWNPSAPRFRNAGNWQRPNYGQQVAWNNRNFNQFQRAQRAQFLQQQKMKRDYYKAMHRHHHR